MSVKDGLSHLQPWTDDGEKLSGEGRLGTQGSRVGALLAEDPLLFRDVLVRDILCSLQENHTMAWI